jgi:hypothetical protein
VRDAQVQVFQLETKENTVQAYENFIHDFSTNPFVNDAWKSLYRILIADYQKETIVKFKNDYPDFPYPELIDQDLKLVGRQLYQYIKQGKYGFMSRDGKSMIAPTFEYAGYFNNGLAVVSKNGKFGYIDKTGELLIDYKFDQSFDFKNGKSVVIKDEMYGLINPSGKYVLEPKYLDIGDFSEGLMYVQSKKGFQYYTTDGTVAFTSFFDKASSFENGIAKVQKDNKEGYIRKDGSFIITVDHGELYHYKDSVFVHKLNDSSNLITDNDNYLFDRFFNEIGLIVEDRAIVLQDEKYGYLNGSGELVIPLEFAPFSNFFQFAQFKNQHALIQRGNLYGLIDSLGNGVYPAIFNGIGSFGLLTPVSKGEGWGYASKDVHLEIPYEYNYAYSFKKGKAVVENAEGMGLIDKNNEIIIPFEYADLKRLKSGLIIAHKDGLYGIMNEKGETVVDIEYRRINQFGSDLFQLVKNQFISYFDVSKQQMITLHQ